MGGRGPPGGNLLGPVESSRPRRRCEIAILLSMERLYPMCAGVRLGLGLYGVGGNRPFEAADPGAQVSDDH